ncbi:MAG: hypothetical protein K0S47_1996 [Herbinix sp.]|jgi:DNA processing protein|nr:hypothetical protein [Herbinix sp.]
MIREEYNYWLATLKNIGPRKIEHLLNIFPSSEAIFYAPKEELMNKTNLNEQDIEIIITSKEKEKITEKYAKLLDNGIYFVSKEDSRYPEKLKQIYSAPFALFVKGKLPDVNRKSLAVVGARDCSGYGQEMAKYISGELAKERIAIISGLARGIDAYAHDGALKANGLTYGILGCGIDICYPKENAFLYRKIQEQGGILSEYEPGIMPLAHQFPMRNRIISGLSDGILVIEAKERSGSFITVDMGLEQGKDIYALPGRVTDRLSEGCNNLIKMGAKLITSPKDILEELLPDHSPTLTDGKKNNNLLETNGKIVYACLSLVPKHIEELAQETKLPMIELMEQLILLELGGYAHQSMKNYYQITNT